MKDLMYDCWIVNECCSAEFLKLTTCYNWIELKCASVETFGSQFKCNYWLSLDVLLGHFRQFKPSIGAGLMLFIGK